MTTKYADLAHLVERDLAKVEVAGSTPVIRSIGSLAQLGEHLPYKQEVIGSIPITSTKLNHSTEWFFITFCRSGGMAENSMCWCGGMADASDSKSDTGNSVWVQVPPPAPNKILIVR